MSMTEWARREVEIACKLENPNRAEGQWDYGCACYESALKAFESIMADGHSGFSIGITKQILNRLIDGKPLTPIEDTEDNWNDIILTRDEYTSYQCKRMSSLFKDVYKDGTVKYTDIDRSYCTYINNSVSTYHSGLERKIINEMFPITMPYYPATTPYKTYCEDFLTNPENGDFDTMGILYVVKPDGEKVDINRFFKGDKNDKDWVEITKEQYDERKAKAIK